MGGAGSTDSETGWCRLGTDVDPELPSWRAAAGALGPGVLGDQFAQERPVISREQGRE